MSNINDLFNTHLDANDAMEEGTPFLSDEEFAEARESNPYYPFKSPYEVREFVLNWALETAKLRNTKSKFKKIISSWRFERNYEYFKLNSD